MSPLAVCPISRKSAVHLVRAEVKLFGLAVLRARLGHEDLVVPLEDDSGKDAVTVRTYRLSLSDEVALGNLLADF